MTTQNIQTSQKSKIHTSLHTDNLASSEHNQNLKNYLYLSKSGKQRYMEISRQSYLTMFLWSGVGIASGYTVYKFVPYVRFLRRYPKFGKTTFAICSIMFSYHGYKLMGYQKKKGIRQMSKIPEYQLTREQYETQIKNGNNQKV